MRLIISFSCLLVFIFSGCSTYNSPFVRLEENSFHKPPLNDNTLLIVSTNSLMSNQNVQKEAFSVDEHKHPMWIKTGGLKTFKNYIEILKEKYPDRLLIVDSGNVFAPKTNIKSVKKIIKKYAKIGHQAVAFGKSELPYLNYIESTSIDDQLFVNSNIYHLQKILISSPAISPYKIIDKNNMKIGIISLFFPSVPEQFDNYFFEDGVLAILKIKKQINNKIDFLIVMVDIETGCKSLNPTEDILFSNSAKGQLQCPNDDKLIGLIKRFPPNTIDLLITNTPTFSNGFINQLPVMGNPGLGKYFSTASITFNSEKQIMPNASIIHTPTKICEQFFPFKNHCDVNPQDVQLSVIHADAIKKSAALPTTKDYELKPARFLGKIISDK